MSLAPIPEARQNKVCKRSIQGSAPEINRREYAHTIYPPLAQFIYLVVTRVSETAPWMKAALVGFEAVTLWALAALLATFGLPRQRVLLYAWHPLIVWE